MLAAAVALAAALANIADASATSSTYPMLCEAHTQVHTKERLNDTAGNHTLEVLKGLDGEHCCYFCSTHASCRSWSFSRSSKPPQAAADPSICYFYDTEDLPKLVSNDSFWGERLQPPAPPTPSPAPSPAPSPTPTPTPPTPPAPSPTPGGVKHWAVIAAGSSGFVNYRHQADACHAYQIARRNGIPKEQIILMMEDNVANSPKNPFPGKLFNQPTAAGEPGVDVYDGCEPTYRDMAVTADLFRDVLTGTKNGRGKATKVLESGPNDLVFVYFADHGGAGFVEFPNGRYLHYADLNATFTTMHSQGMYKKMVVYFDACMAGSMFSNVLSPDLNIFVTTSANPKENAYGAYCPPFDLVEGKHMQTCLGDLYSVNWMQDSDTAQGLNHTLDEQLAIVKQKTNKSHVSEYGTVGTFSATDTVGEYQGGGGEPSAGRTRASAQAVAASGRDHARSMAGAVDSRDIPLVTAFYSYLWAGEGNGKKKRVLAEELIALVRAREKADRVFGTVLRMLEQEAKESHVATPVLEGEVVQCQKRVYAAVRAHCGWFDDYSLKYSVALVEYCARIRSTTIERALMVRCNGGRVGGGAQHGADIVQV